MKLLVIGASGLVGTNLLSVARENGHEAVGTYNSHFVPGLREFALHDIPVFEELLREENPDAVICSAAWVWADGCERNPARAFSLNRDYPRALADATRRTGARFVYLSTNYVFDGEEGPYTEEDKPDPINIYGRSKLSAEREILQITRGEAVIVRTAGVYGREFQGKNFLYQVVRNLRAGRLMQVPDDQFGNATSAVDLSLGIIRLLEKDLAGVWNLAGPDPHLCRIDFAALIAQEYDLDADLLQPTPSSKLGQLAKRPRQAGLLIDKARKAIGFDPVPWVKIPGIN